MAQAELINKYKDMLINAGIIIVALIIAFNVYNGGSSNVESLRIKISEEEKKNIELDKIGKLEKKIAAYRTLLAEREASAVMSDISAIAKDAEVEVLSVKPSQKESRDNYNKAIFEVTVNAGGYDQLAKFINLVEAYENVYMVENIDINSQPELGKAELKASLSISSVSANQ